VQKTWTVLVPVQRQVVQKIDGEKVEIYGIDGKKISPEEVRKLARKTVPALLSADGKPVDPFYLRLAREGTLVIVVSTKGPGPAFAPNREKLKPDREKK
jgi:hypothetical protein